MQHECAGFHFCGLSSTGKTTALRVAGSVWGGGGEHGFIDTWRATANGLEARAALHNHALLCLDEISQVSEKDVGDVIYLLGNGTAKSRMTKTIAARPALNFRLLYLSTGERTLSEMMKSAGKHSKAGQELRLTEIPADAAKGMGIFEALHGVKAPDQLARELSDASAQYYGTAIRAFLNRLVPERGQACDYVRRVQQQFIKTYVTTDAAGEVYRVAASFGLVAGAGELATAYGVTKWKEGVSRRAAVACFQDWLLARGSTGPLDVERGLQEVVEFVTQNHTRFHNLREDPSTWPRLQNSPGYRKKQGSGDPNSGWTYYIHTKVFREEICGPYDYRAVYKAMIDRHWARTSKGRSLAYAKNIKGVGFGRYFVVLPAALQGDEDHDD